MVFKYPNSKFMLRNSKLSKGFTILETLIGIALFLIIGGGVYFAYANILEVITRSRLNQVAVFIMEREIEIIRNMPYEDIGVQGGSPAGLIPPQKTVESGSLSFEINTSIRNIDDPFDGLATTFNDTAPADYRLVELEISCLNCTIPFSPAKITATVAPAGLETETKNGSLFIKIINASGQPVSSAEINVLNSSVNPDININDTSNGDGGLQLVDIATSSSAYEVSVSKAGYSQEKTYPIGEPSNPSPSKPHATVAEQQITQISFVIDLLGTINFKSHDNLCEPVTNIDYLQEGQKLIGSSPDILKYSASSDTGATGDKSITNLEFDTYTFTNLDTNYDISGTSSMMPLILDPGTTLNLNWTMKNKTPSSLLVVIEDENGQMINDAKVELSKTGYSTTVLSGRSSISYTDWSANEYDSKSPNIDPSSVAGQITLMDLGGNVYASNSQEWLISKTIDFGTSDSVFHKIWWTPVSQPAQTGNDSLKFQLAGNNDNTTWNFIGPDGTANSYYASSGMDIWSDHTNNRYMKYKAFMQTSDENFTPLLQEVNLEFSSSCVANGQTFFSNLTQDTYNIQITKSGLQTHTGTLPVTAGWQIYRVTLIP